MPALKALGFPPEARVAIFHADDVGMNQGSNLAFQELSRLGAINCGAVMVPCPWYHEAAGMAAGRPGSRFRGSSDPNQRMADLSLAAYFNDDPQFRTD